ncbi:MAG: hypothetical protein Q8Q87_02085 [Candidatus Omnitrophota bacterium]|nr:hypothetical protein [Candidatus Omnitrophota bacterium]
MKSIYLAFGICVVMSLAGCANFAETKVSMPYVMQTERLDQKIEGNRGYLKGTPPPAEDKTGRKRPFIAIDVDLPQTSREAGIPETKMVNASKEASGMKEEQIK